jgi:hypothetical protein
MDQVMQLSYDGKDYNEIASQLGIKHVQVGRILNNIVRANDGY